MTSVVSTPEGARDPVRVGVIAAIGAYAAWGILPAYLRLVEFADPLEVLALRIFWTIPAALVAIAATSGWRRGLREVRAALRPPVLGALCVSAVFILVNWGLFVWAVAQERLLEGSLAYFLAPLVGVGLGVALFRERISRAQLAALALAGVGVVVMGLALGAPPWIAIGLCATWSVYALVRKQTPVPAAVGLLVETLVLVLPAGALLAWVAHTSGLKTDDSAANMALLALSGPATATPLILFSLAARRVRFATLGMLQYIAPTGQFLLGLLWGEPFTALHAASFTLIWIGLACFSADALNRDRKAREAPPPPV